MKTSSARRVRAALASTAVLGVGAVATLAFWTDSEFLISPFGSSGFQVESATSLTGPFEFHGGVENAAALPFNFPADELVEGQPVAAEFWLRMASENTGSVSVLAPTAERGDLAGLIEVTVAQGSCGSAGQILQEGFLEELVNAPDAFLLPAASGGTPGPAQPVCITATLTDISELPVGEYSTGRVAWEFVVAEEVA